MSGFWSDLRRLEPVSRVFGFDRGMPIDRYYIEKFLSAHSADIHGRVLEIADSTYTKKFGGSCVAQSDVLHATPGNRHATIVGDLCRGTGVPNETFDCIILTQVLPFVFDVAAAVRTCAAALKPGGIVLATVPGISQISRYDMDRWGDFWRFTTASARKLFEQAFLAPSPGNPGEGRGEGTASANGLGIRNHPHPDPLPDYRARENVHVAAFGNVLAATAFLQGLAAEELTPEELDFVDRDYELLITIRASRGHE